MPIRQLLLQGKKLVNRIGAADYCPLYRQSNPWSAPDAGQQLRHWASRHQFQTHPRWLRWAFILVLTTIWPLHVLRLVGQNAHKFAPKIAIRSGKPVWAQCWEQLWLALSHALPPLAYYHYELYLPERRVLVDQYIHQYEAGSLLPYLNRYQRHPAIADKTQFALLCAQQGLPTPPVLGVCEQGKWRWQSDCSLTVASESDIFVKPARGYRGEGAMLWRRLAPNQYQDQAGTILGWGELVEHLTTLGCHQVYVVQPRLRNHPAIADLSTGALCTARIVTGRTPTGSIEVIVATFKMGWKQQITNTHGLNSAIDLETSTLGRAYAYRPICPGYAMHPETGAAISGRTLPDWQAALALAQEVHQSFPGYVFLGWDVALTPQGPLLLEGNAGWDVLTVQKPQQMPLAYTRFAAICALWMQERSHP